MSGFRAASRTRATLADSGVFQPEAAGEVCFCQLDALSARAPMRYSTPGPSRGQARCTTSSSRAIAVEATGASVDCTSVSFQDAPRSRETATLSPDPATGRAATKVPVLRSHASESGAAFFDGRSPTVAILTGLVQA